MSKQFALVGAALAAALLVGPGSAQALTNGDIIMVTGNKVLRVDPDTGDRVVISGCADDTCSSLVGSGPMFLCDDGDLEIEASGAIIVSAYDETWTYSAIFRIDPETGNRTIVSGSSVGTGPGGNDTFRGLGVFDLPPAVTSLGNVGLICLGVGFGMLAKRMTVNGARKG